MSGIRRVVVGASGSPGSLRALRYAENLARANSATLIPVLAWVPPGGDLTDRRAGCGFLLSPGARCLPSHRPHSLRKSAMACSGGCSGTGR